jgi:hypothetical protein
MMQSGIIYGPEATPQNDTVVGLPQDEFIALAQSILIVLPHRGSEGLHPGLSMNIGPWSMVGTSVQPVEDQFGGFIELTRGGIARRFLDICAENPKIDKLVMIDSDENMHWDAPYKLAMWDQPVVSGVVCSWTPRRGIFACFTMKDKYGVPRFPSVRYTKTLPARGLLKVWNTGTGMICIKKGVLESIFESGDVPFYVPEAMRRAAVPSGVLKHGEDMAFSQQCERLGFDRFVDLSVHAVHFKVTPICWPQTDECVSDALSAADFQVDVKDYLHG